MNFGIAMKIVGIGGREKTLYAGMGLSINVVVRVAILCYINAFKHLLFPKHWLRHRPLGSKPTYR